MLRPRALACACADHDAGAAGRKAIDERLAPPVGCGRLRLLVYQRLKWGSTPKIDPEFLITELRRLLTPPRGEMQSH